MSNNVYSLEKYRMSKNNNLRMEIVFKLIAWAVLAIGCILFLANVNDFSSTNLGLMIGIGMMISGMQIYGIGVVVQLLQSRPVNNR